MDCTKALLRRILASNCQRLPIWKLCEEGTSIFQHRQQGIASEVIWLRLFDDSYCLEHYLTVTSAHLLGMNLCWYIYSIYSLQHSSLVGTSHFSPNKHCVPGDGWYVLHHFYWWQAQNESGVRHFNIIFGLGRLSHRWFQHGIQDIESRPPRQHWSWAGSSWGHHSPEGGIWTWRCPGIPRTTEWGSKSRFRALWLWAAWLRRQAACP